MPNLSKVFERCLHKQISDVLIPFCLKYQFGFRKGHGAQHCLIALLEKWRGSIDRGLEFGILLTDLSKAFDCLPHDLFVAKLFAYGFDDKALRFIYDYLRHRKQRTHIVHGKKFYMVFPKDQLWGHCYLMQTRVTFLLP